MTTESAKRSTLPQVDLASPGLGADQGRAERAPATTGQNPGRAILAIDPGTHCGWALLLRDGRRFSGTWDLKPSRFEGGGMRWLRLSGFLDGAGKNQIDLVAYEEVRRHMGVDAAHVYGGIVATLQSWCESRKIPYYAIPVGTIKKLATGKGNAKKDAMIAAATARWPGQQVADDNQADALWILEAASIEYGLGIPIKTGPPQQAGGES